MQLWQQKLEVVRYFSLASRTKNAIYNHVLVTSSPALCFPLFLSKQLQCCKQETAFKCISPWGSVYIQKALQMGEKYYKVRLEKTGSQLGTLQIASVSTSSRGFRKLGIPGSWCHFCGRNCKWHSFERIARKDGCKMFWRSACLSGLCQNLWILLLVHKFTFH